MSKQIANMILQQAKATGADPYTLLATAIVESNLNPNAVGDGGTSYGLYQMHVGGAGGGSHGEARRYLDPSTAIENRARHFRGGRGGAFAASVQRPADAAGYARKVDSVIAQLRSGKLPYAKGNLNAPVVSGGVSGANAGTSDRKAAALNLIFGDDPIMQLAARSIGSDVGSQPMAKQKFAGGAEGRGFFKRLPGETGQQYLDRLLQKKFGLKHDAGNAQTTGGRHTEGSLHYQGLATDYGDAKNPVPVLNAAVDWIDKNRNNFVGGIAELYGPGDAGHPHSMHVATIRSLRGGKKRKA